MIICKIQETSCISPYAEQSSLLLSFRLLSNNPLMATDLQVWGRHLASKTNVDRTTNIECKVLRCTHRFLAISGKVFEKTRG